MATREGASRTIYRHTQVGVLPIILWLIVTASCAAMWLASATPVYLVAAAIMAAVGLGMSCLTTTVSPDQVEVTFGPRMFRRRIAVAEILSAEPAFTSAWEGWGIRFTGEGLLYNISGNQAVRLHLRSGKKLRIGTDDPAGLTAAITTSLTALAISAPSRSEPRVHDR